MYSYNIKFLTEDNLTSASNPLNFTSQHKDTQQMLEEYDYIYLMSVASLRNFTKNVKT